MIKFVYETTKNNEFDWLLKADDDTYVIMENLKWFLKDRCSNESKTYGFNLKYKGTQFQSGGGGYLISSKVVNKLGAALENDNNFCDMKIGTEDVEMAKCLKKFNVTLGESRDTKGRERFHAVNFKDHWDGTAEWLKRLAMNQLKYVNITIFIFYLKILELLMFFFVLYKSYRSFNDNKKQRTLFLLDRYYLLKLRAIKI